MRVIGVDLWNTIVKTLASPTGASYGDVLVRLGVPQEEIYPFVREQLMTRRIDYDVMIDYLFSHFGIMAHEAQKREAVSLWKEDNNRAIWFDGAKELLRLLRQGQDALVLISNVTFPAWEKINTELGVAEEFDRVVCSCDLGMAKPDPRMWQVVENWYPAASEFWMVGDNELNDLAVPRQMGWKTALVDEDGFRQLHINLLKGDRP